MLKILANLSFIIAITVSIIFSIKSYRRKQHCDKILGGVNCSTALIFLFYFLNCNVQFSGPKAVFASFEHIANLWALLFLLVYTYAFIKRPVMKTPLFSFVGALALDSALLLTNHINHFMADITIYNSPVFDMAVLSPKSIYLYHIICALVLVIVQAAVLILAYVKSPKLYRTKYIVYLAAYFFIAVPSLIFILSGGAISGHARWTYAIGIVILYFDTYVYMPERIESAYLKYIDNAVLDATIIFDDEGNLVHSNAQAKALNIISKPDEGATKQVINGTAYQVINKPIPDERGNIIAHTYVFHDASDDETRLIREHQISIFDPLTGVYNRIGFFEEAKKFLEQHGKEGNYAVMISGIVDFKGINSLYGTKVGDRVLKEIAEKLHKSHHDYPMIYGRTAEGKFASILPFEHVETLASELNCTEISLGDEMNVHADMCHGFVVMDDDIKNFEYYYELAIIALDKCKGKAGAVVLEYSDDMAEDRHRKQMLLSETHNAIAEGQFYIVLQPQIDLKTNTVAGAEALVRWNHPTLGPISPAEFIPLFENNGFISNLDKFVWEEACVNIARFTKHGVYTGPISVNVSQVDIMNMNVAECLYEITQKHHVPVEKLHVEITESAYADNPELLIRTMNSLRDKGFLVEVDDFGSGYSSLYSLIKLPFDIVKLDMMFMRQASDDPKSKIVIESIVKMIHSLKAKIIVEGVEFENNAKQSKEYDCDVAQGFFYSKPLSILDFTEFVKNYEKMNNGSN